MRPDFVTPVQVGFKKLHPLAQAPVYSTAGAAGADLRAVETTVVPARGRALVKTGLAIELPPGFEAQIRSRSGLAFKNGVAVLNAPGTIDEDYRGELGVILFNVSDEDFHVEPGDRIAQLVVARYAQVNFQEADELSHAERGEGGFGSTGIK